MPKTKICNICNEEKPASEFQRKKDRLHPYCKPCQKEYRDHQDRGELGKFWSEYADTSGESRLQALRRTRAHDPEAVGLWQIGQAMQDEMSNEAADTKIMVRFTGSNLAA